MASFRMAFFRLIALVFRRFAWRISLFRLLAWLYFVFSLFRKAFFSLFRLSACCYFVLAPRHGKKTEKRNNEKAQTSHNISMALTIQCVLSIKIHC